ncbi:MAG: hypothetical protein EOL97_09660 [Spirochaetia bacterium]|nr:hypothetical protein [Spirochaetia bacterium]
MPYSIKKLPDVVKKLPIRGKKIFISAFNKANAKYDEETSFKLAWNAVKKVYTKKNDNWVAVKKKKVVARSSYFLSPNYYYDAVLGTNELHYDNKRVSEDLLKNGKIDNLGDFNHYGVDSGDFKYKGIFKLVKQVYEDGKLYLRFTLDRNHSSYNDFITKIEDTDSELKLSAEYINAVEKDNVIVSADEIGWTVLLDNEMKPADYGAGVFTYKAM